jgi:hypothetical protein
MEGNGFRAKAVSRRTPELSVTILRSGPQHQQMVPSNSVVSIIYQIEAVVNRSFATYMATTHSLHPHPTQMSLECQQERNLSYATLTFALRCGIF